MNQFSRFRSPTPYTKDSALMARHRHDTQRIYNKLPYGASKFRVVSLFHETVSPRVSPSTFLICDRVDFKKGDGSTLAYR